MCIYAENFIFGPIFYLGISVVESECTQYLNGFGHHDAFYVSFFKKGLIDWGSGSSQVEDGKRS